MNTTSEDQLQLNQILSTKALGQRSYFFETAESTNDHAWEKLAEGAPHGTLIVAKEQTQGRGRHGRRWFSPNGGLWCSIILDTSLLPNIQLGQIPLLIGVAITETLKNNFNLNVTLKWPNDLLVNNKKIAGILSESRQIRKSTGNITNNEKRAVVVGIGLNCNIQKENFPNDLQMEPTSILIEKSQQIDIIKLLSDILFSIENWFDVYSNEGFAAIKSAWKQHSGILGEIVKIDTGPDTFSGKVIDIDNTGALLIEEPNGNTKTVIAGDILLSRETY